MAIPHSIDEPSLKCNLASFRYRQELQGILQKPSAKQRCETGDKRLENNHSGVFQMVYLMERGNLMLISIIYLCFSTVCFSSISKKKNDLSLHQYSEGGEVVQVSYASQAVDRSSTGLIGFSERDFSVVFAIRPKPSSLQVLPASKFVIEKFTQSVGVAMCGYSADNEYSRSKCNLVKQLHILRFGETPLIDNVAKSMSRWLTRGMYIGEEDAVLRPVATAVLLFGRDSSDSSHRLVLVENSGSVKECSFVSTGNIPGSAVTLMNIQRIVQHGIDDTDHADGTDWRLRRPGRTLVLLVLGNRTYTNLFYLSDMGR